MNVKEIGNNINLRGGPAKRVDLSGSDSDFKKIFKDSLSSRPTSDDSISHDIKLNLVKKSERLIDLMEEVAKGLSDFTIGIEDLRDTVRQIQRELTGLREETPENIHNDKELEHIINRITTEANLFVYRYNRGDYI